MKDKTFVEVMRIYGVGVFIHWSVLVVGAVILFARRERPLVAIATVISYMGLLLLHETGHLIAARRRRYQVLAIELYPIGGIARIETAATRIDRDVIAWGGIVAQLVVAVPIVTLMEIFGFTRHAPLNAVLTIFGYFSVLVAIFNLVPFSPLDGATAWDLIPALIQRARAKPSKQALRYRSPR